MKLILLFIVACLAISCSVIPRVKCGHTTNIPVTYIGLDSIARTVYVPFCDTLVQLPPKVKKN